MKKLFRPAHFTAPAAAILATSVIAACSSPVTGEDEREQENLKKAVYCMELLEVEKNLSLARNECFADEYIQHTPWIPDGRDAVLDIFADRFEKYPEFNIEIKRASADGDLVWIHLHSKRTPDVRGNAVINIFRMKDGKFVEHWNVSQPVPEISANANTMF